jgi:hypothetical protein
MRIDMRSEEAFVGAYLYFVPQKNVTFTTHIGVYGPAR